MALCQLMIFSRAEDTAWLQKVLRAYQILFCAIFVSSEFRLENKLKFLPALQNWVTRGFLYTFVSVIGYEGESLQIQLSTSLDITSKLRAHSKNGALPLIDDSTRGYDGTALYKWQMDP